jgi:ComF family protein
MIDTVLSFLAPHHCYGCDKIGTPLCQNCKYDIVTEPYNCCIICSRPTLELKSACSVCLVPYSQAWCVGERTSELKRLIGGFKFQNVKQAYKPLAELIHDTLPDLPASTVIIPVPTVSAHIRERGYDHTLLMARYLAKLRRLNLNTSLKRATNTKQRGADRRMRAQQAKVAFSCNAVLDPAVPYLLIDDVVTTGATLEYATKTLQAAGAKTVWVATVSKQPLRARSSSIHSA